MDKVYVIGAGNEGGGGGATLQKGVALPIHKYKRIIVLIRHSIAIFISSLEMHNTCLDTCACTSPHEYGAMSVSNRSLLVAPKTHPFRL